MVTISDVDKLSALQSKLLLWKNKILENDICIFETLHDHLKDKPLSQAVQDDVSDHLSQLHEQFRHYFPNLFADASLQRLARNPFTRESTMLLCKRSALIG